MIESMQPSKRSKALIIVLVVLVGVFVLGFLIRAIFFTAIRSQSFYAIFLDNGQVYFGKVEKQTENEIILGHVFYLKANTDLSTSNEEMPNANLSLIKLGNEIYKPYDRMLINRSHVLFLEEMRPGSDIMNAIEKHEEQEK